MNPDAAPDIYAYFERSVRRHPDRDALRIAGRTLTYRRVDELVSRLAARLPARSPIALLSTRTLLTYVGYLAVLRRAGSVVPLNQKYPASRLATVLDLAGADAVLCDARCRDLLPADVTVHSLSEADVIALDGPGSPALPARDDDIAYVLFTSGTTGRPKGVPIRHRNVMDFVDYNIARYEVGPDCRLSQTFELTFDPSVFDLFVAWGAGATLVVPDDDDLFDVAAFVSRETVTHWYSVPGLITANAATKSLGSHSMPGLRYSLFAGEQLALDSAGLWHDAAPNSIIENLYGPTELTVTVSSYRLPADRGHWPTTANGTVPIGSLYPHLEGSVTDAGELLVRGSQRFDGYLDDRDNIGQFLDNMGRPVHDVDETSWYRTGDRVANEADALVHLGRLDDQLKLLGQRVELGDVEVSLRKQDGVTDAVALAVPDENGGMSLAALYSGRSRPGSEMRHSLAENLPPHMVPRWLQYVEAIPRNAHGKVDREHCRTLFRQPGRGRH